MTHFQSMSTPTHTAPTLRWVRVSVRGCPRAAAPGRYRLQRRLSHCACAPTVTVWRQQACWLQVEGTAPVAQSTCTEAPTSAHASHSHPIMAWPGAVANGRLPHPAHDTHSHSCTLQSCLINHQKQQFSTSAPSSTHKYPSLCAATATAAAAAALACKWKINLHDQLVVAACNTQTQSAQMQINPIKPAYHHHHHHHPAAASFSSFFAAAAAVYVAVLVLLVLVQPAVCWPGDSAPPARGQPCKPGVAAPFAADWTQSLTQPCAPCCA